MLKSYLFRIDLFWERSTKKLSFGLVSEASQAIGGLIEYDSMPSSGDDSDDSYDCSIAFHEDHVSIFTKYTLFNNNVQNELCQF